MADLARRCGAPRTSRRAAMVCTIGLFASVMATTSSVAVQTSPAAADTVVDVMAWAPWWEAADALASFNARPSMFSELTPFFWTATGSSITFNPKLGSPNTRLAEYKAAAAATGKPLVATIVDGMPARAMAAVLADPATRTQHVQTIVQFVVANGFSGVDIDYEQFAFSDGKSTWPATHDYWGAFITELADLLHANGTTLAVAVPPIYNNNKDATSGYWVYNFPILAQKVDRVRIMTYSYSGNGVGPIAPYQWVGQSMDGAIAAGVPTSKIVMGIAAYGNDVVTKVEGSCPVDPVTNTQIVPTKRNITTATAPQIAANKGVTPRWDAEKHERTFSYMETFAGADVGGNTVRCNVSRTVWYSDTQAIYERVLLAQSKGLAGVALWALGYDDAVLWEGIAAARGNQVWAAPGPIAPSVKAPAVLAPYPAPIYSPIGPLPARFLDTRAGAKTTDGQYAGKGRVNAGATLEVKIAGRGTVAAAAEAVTLNVTAIGEGNGYVTVYPCGVRPTTSSLNVQSGQIISNSVITKLSAAGTVCLYSQAHAHLVVDVFNVLPASAFTPVESPARLFDSRSGLPTIDGQFAGGGALAPGIVVEVPVAGRGGMTSTTRTAVLNVTADGAVGPGFLTIWPCDSPRPATSNVNYVANTPIPNSVVTGLSARGTVCLVSSNTTHVVIDTFGGLEPDRYQALVQPTRLLDTRGGGPTVDAAFSGGGIRPAGSVIELQVGGRGGLPAGAGAAILNVTVDGPTADGFVTVYPCASGRPLVSNVNFAPGQTLPNLVVTTLSATGTVCIFNLVPTHIVVDVFGDLTL